MTATTLLQAMGRSYVVHRRTSCYLKKKTLKKWSWQLHRTSSEASNLFTFGHSHRVVSGHIFSKSTTSGAVGGQEFRNTPCVNTQLSYTPCVNTELSYTPCVNTPLSWPAWETSPRRQSCHEGCYRVLHSRAKLEKLILAQTCVASNGTLNM